MKARVLPEVWGSYKMVREKPADQRCQYNGEDCRQKINGRGAWYYCSECRKAALKEAKRERDRKRSAKRREGEDDRAEDNFYHYLFYHDLTEPQLRPLFDRAEAQQEAEPYSKYEGYEYAFKKFHEAEDVILNPAPHADLPSVAQIANDKVEELLGDLAKSQRESPRDSMIKRLFLSTGSSPLNRGEVCLQ